MSEPIRRRVVYSSKETLLSPKGKSLEVGVLRPGHWMPLIAEYEDRCGYRWFYSGGKFSMALPMSTLTEEHLSQNP